MKAAVYYENGPPGVLKYEDVADPVLDAHSVLIRVEAIAIEGGDTLNRLGGELVTKPHVVGYQAAGTIVDVGDQVQGLKRGQRVATLNMFGSHAELRVVPEPLCWAVPDGLDIKQASLVPVTFGTADDCLFEFGRLHGAETVLIQAGASGVGIAAIQLAKRTGATVIATASSADRLERLKAYGMDHGIDYRTKDVVAEVMKLTDGKGVNLVVDPVGGATLEGSLGALAYRGRVSLVGNAGREPQKADVSNLMPGNRSLTGVFLGAEVLTDRVRTMIGRHMADVATGRLTAVVDKTFPLSEAAAAHAYIESRQAVGRVLLIP